ncbi:BA14K family protein [Bradyrhizobium tunisiense]|uniref:BA14K family protein n=1 Tax=Bradyrhizobium tunisiense TaxID=3278709 RepID=UPI0035DEFD4A
MPIGIPANAAPISPAGVTTKNDANVVEVQWRHHRHHGRHHWRDGYRYGPGWGPAVGGFVAGAAIGGAVANSRAQAAEDNAYCSRRYNSYDPSSGTYMGYDGVRHPCP